MLSTAIQCVLIVALPTQVAKTEKLTPKEKAHIKQLVRELDHRERGKRDAAEKKLTAMGPKILSFLPPITRRTPAEVKVRLGRVINSIETKVAKQTAKETYVTLKGEMELAKVMQAIQKQTGNTIAGYADRDATIKVDFKKVPFWKAMDNIGEKLVGFSKVFDSLCLIAEAKLKHTDFEVSAPPTIGSRKGPQLLKLTSLNSHLTIAEPDVFISATCFDV